MRKRDDVQSHDDGFERPTHTVQAGVVVTNQARIGGYGAVAGGLALFVGGSSLAFYTNGGLSPLWLGVFLLGGIVLLLLEAFVIPGFGPVGVASIVLLLLALVAAVVPDGRGDSLLAGRIIADITTRHLVGTLGAAAAIAGGALLAIHAPRLPVLSKLTLATPDGAALALAHPHPDVAHIGEVGEVIADLRPAGRARFGAEMVDVRTRGEYVSAGVRVEVLKREGAAIIVRPFPETHDSPLAT